MVDDVINEASGRFEKVIESLRRDLSRMRTGRANLAILDGIRVPYYGSPTSLNSVAALNVADARLITVKPWDKTLITAIEKAIIAADIGINPSSDGELIRLPIPALTGERRKELVKIVRKSGEEAKVALRTIRREANELLKAAKDEGDLPEDDYNRGLKKIQDKTDEYGKKADEAVTAKEKEITEI